MARSKVTESDKSVGAPVEEKIKSVRKRKATTKVEPTTPLVTDVVTTPLKSSERATPTYQVSKGTPYITEADYTQRLEHIRGQIRAEKIHQENAKLTKEVAVAEGLDIQADTQKTKVAIFRKRYETEDVLLQREGVKYSIEGERLAQDKIELAGERQITPLKQQTWNLRIEALKTDVDTAKAMLAQKRQELPSVIDI